MQYSIGKPRFLWFDFWKAFTIQILHQQLSKQRVTANSPVKHPVNPLSNISIARMFFFHWQVSCSVKQSPKKFCEYIPPDCWSIISNYLHVFSLISPVCILMCGLQTIDILLCFWLTLHERKFSHVCKIANCVARKCRVCKEPAVNMLYVY